ncbi:unnamed protein product, partial [Brenthis ino]
MLDDGILTGYEDHSLTQMEEEAIDPTTLHELLVKHVLDVSGELNSRLDVWGEHSYARARGAAPNSQIRVLLSPLEPAPEADEFVDVEAEPRPLPALPLDREPEDEDGGGEDEDEDDEWEERLMELTPSAALRRLAAAALGALRDLRLARLAGREARGGRWARREGAAAAARRLRRALAPHWAGGAAWLHAALLAALPRTLAPLYAEVLAELRRQLPRLGRAAAGTARLGAAPGAARGGRRASAPGPWLAWAPSGSAAEDERWVRRLGALLHTRLLRAPAAASAAPAPPERWCAALAHEARGALADVLADAGRRAVVVGGAGAGAALGVWLAAGATRARGLLLLAPPLLTAEGPRDAPEDILEEVEIPLLAVVGGGAAQCWRGAAAELAGRGEARRVLVLAGADDALRLPRAHRLRLRLPQHALDAAVAEECARWALEVAESPEPPPRARRKGTSTGLESDDIRPPPTANRSIEIIEGRVAPRAPPALAAADIMQLPIVFADDEPPASAPPTGAPPAPAPPAPARGSAQLRYTRVIVAKRPPAGVARPVLLRRRAAHAPRDT